jgi:hypothetical protein
MRAKPILLLGGACIVGAAAVGLVAELSTSPEVDAIETQPRVAGAPAAAPVLPPISEHRGLARAAATPVSVAASGASEPDLTPPQREQQLVARIDDSLAERLRGERVDPAWARETEASITTTLGGASFAGLRLGALKCGATMCRLSLQASEQVADVDAVIEELTTAQAFRHGGFVRFTAERDLTMFVAREGHPLPPPPST